MRRIWTLTLLTVAVAVAIVAAREYHKSNRVDARRTDPVPAATRDKEYNALVANMFAKLEEDHQAWHGDTQKAVETLAALAERGERDTAEAHYALGVRLAGERKFAEAEKEYRAAIARRPGWSWPYDGLGLALYEQGRKDDALKSFAKSSELEPLSPRPHSDLSVLLRLDNRLDEAEKEAAIAVKLAPNRLDTLNTYANVLKEQGKTEEALKYYQKAIAADANHPTPYYNLACLYIKLGEPERTLALLEQAFALDPSFADFARRDHDLEPLRKDPRLKALLDKKK